MTVPYSLKELLQDIRDEMRHMVEMIGGKADKSEVVALHQRVDNTDRRVDVLEDHVSHQRKSAAETLQRRAWLWPAVAALATVALVVVSFVH